MTINYKLAVLFASITAIMLHTEAIAGTQPKFTLVPTTATTVSVPSTGTQTVQYQVTNQTKITRTLTITPITAVTQNVSTPGACSSPFTLASKQSCLLTLTVNGGQIPIGGIHEGPKVCKTIGNGNNNPDPFLCSQPEQNAILNVIQSTVHPHKIAVGVAVSTATSNNMPISYVSNDNGVTWHISSALPSLPSLATDGALNGIACDSIKLKCTAIGYAIDLSTPSFPLAYTSDDGGESWTLSAPLPMRAGATESKLSSVSCDSSRIKCTAVGYDVQAKNAPVAYVSNNGGQSWVLSDDIPLPDLAIDGELKGIACDTARQLCVAVGIVDGSLPLSYTSTNGGQSWAVSNTLPVPPANSSNIRLNAVSCNASGLRCTAVGTYTDDNSSNDKPLSYTTLNGGQTWSASITSGQPINTDVTLAGVSCDHQGKQCISVGGGI